MPSVLLVCGGTQVKGEDSVDAVVSKGVVKGNDGEKGRFDKTYRGEEGITTDSCKHIVNDVTGRLKAREDVTALTFGAHGTGKTYVMHHLYDMVLKRLADHIETSQEIYEDQLSKAALQNELEVRSNPDETEPLDPFVDLAPPAASRRSISHSPSQSLIAESPRKRSHTPRNSRTPTPRQSRSGSRVKRLSKSPSLLNTIVLSKSPQPVSPLRSPMRESSAIECESPTRKRSSFSPNQSQPQQATGGVTSIPHGNGRKGDSRCLVLNGESSHIKIPPVPDLHDKLMAGFYIECWFKHALTEKPSCMLSIVDSKRPAPRLELLCDMDLDYRYAPGTLMIILQDSNQKTFMATVTVELAGQHWHHMKWSIINIQDHAVTFCLDGETLPIKIGSGEYPNDFSGWDQQGFVGAQLKPCATLLESHFHGTIAELQFLTLKSEPFAHWPLDTADCREVTGLPGTAEPIDVMVEQSAFPDTAYYLNGASSYANIGQVGELGESLSSFTFQAWVRTTMTQKVMTLIGVTDTTHKHAGFGIDLNSSSFGRLAPCRLNLWVRDYTGKTYSCTTEVPSLFDGEWHCLKWTIIEVQLNKMRLQFDRRSCDLDFLTPKSGGRPPFCPFTQWVCLGAHNNRGVVERHFEGCMREVKLWRGKDMMLCAHWPMNEGPGARIAVDTTGCGNGGIYFMGKRKAAKWVCDKSLTRVQPLMTGMPKKLNIAESTLKRFANNRVQFACVAFGAECDAMGTYKEVKYDVIHGDFFDSLVDLAPQESSAYTKEVTSEKYTWLPEHCFETIKPDTYKKLFCDLVCRMQEDDLRNCNTVLVIRLGDARFVGIDMISHQTNKGGSSFDPMHLTWTDAVVTLDTAGKRNLAINKTVQSVLHGLAEVGTSPHITRRCCASSAAAHKRVTEKFDGTDTSQLVCSALYGTSCGTQTLYVFNTMRKYPTREELLAVVSIGNTLYDKTAYWASVLIQKRARGMLDRYRVAVLSSEREAVRARSRHRRSTRHSFPMQTEAKQKHIAILVLATALHPMIPVDPKRSAKALKTFENLETTLLKRGFEVHLFCDNCLRAVGQPALKPVYDHIQRLRSREPDAMMLLHVHGYGVDGRFPKPERPTEVLARILSFEEKGREEHLREEDEERKSISEMFDVGHAEAVGAETVRVEAEVKKTKERKRKSVGTTRSHEIRMKASMEKGASRPPSRQDVQKEVMRRSSIRPRRQSVQAEVHHEEEAVPINPEWLRPITDPEETDNDDHQFLIPQNAEPMFTASSVWMVDDLKHIVLGQAPMLGHHAVVCLDVMSLREDEPSYSIFAASSRQVLSFKYGAGTDEEGLLSSLLAKGVSGSASKYPGEDDPFIGVNKLLEYFTDMLKGFKLPYDIEPHGQYVGEIVLSEVFMPRAGGGGHNVKVTAQGDRRIKFVD